MGDHSHFLIELRYAYLLVGIEEWVHYNLDKYLINLIEKLLYLLLVFVVFMQYQEASSTGRLHAGNIELIIELVDIPHIHVRLLLTRA